MTNLLLDYKNKLNRPLILDGAIGSLLISEGIEEDKYLWSSLANLTQPGIVRKIHTDYAKAGADIITTNTFRTNPAAVKLSGYDIDLNKFVKKSVELAVELKKDFDILVAGSNAPAEDCYQKERTLSFNALEYNHKKHIELLWESGCDFILNETQSHLDEIELICKFCSENQLPYVLSLYFLPNLSLLSGEPVKEAVDLISDFSPAAISFNCVPPEGFEKMINSIQPENQWGFYLNCGLSSPEEGTISCVISPDEYLKDIKKWLPLDPVFVGACCGSNPEHIKKIKEFLDETVDS